jgi:quercetin dioxygenase-like cupin family protein
LSIVEHKDYHPLGPEDPDDYRPKSHIAFVIDPLDAAGRGVRALSFIFEKCAAGDHIPRHTHTTDEAVIVDSGEMEATLGDERRIVPPGTVVFIPAGTSHAWANVGADVASFHAVFPTDVLDITYLERNPAPGTEGNPPQPPLTLDLRSL